MRSSKRGRANINSTIACACRVFVALISWGFIFRLHLPGTNICTNFGRKRIRKALVIKYGP